MARRRSSPRGLAAGLCAAGSLLGGAGALAQEPAESGPRLTFDLDTRLGANDNLDLVADPPGTATYLETRLGLGLVSETRLSRLELDLGAVTRTGDAPGDGDFNGLGEADLRVAYSREVATSRLSFDGRVAYRDLDVFDPFDDTVELPDGSVVTEKAGQRRSAMAGITLETGLTAPLGLVLDLRREATEYTDTTDPDLYDTRETRASVGLRMTLTPTTEGLLEVSRSLYTAEDTLRRERERRAARFDLTHELSGGTVLEASLGVTDIDEIARAGGAPRIEENGFTGSLGLSRPLPLGSIGISAATALETTGRRNTLNLERVIVRPNAELRLGLGVSSDEDGEIEPVADIAYALDLPTGALEASLSQSVTTSDEDEDLSRLRASLNYVHDINALSRLSLGADYVSVSDLGAGSAGDEERATLSVTYSRDITRDWSLDLGYSHDREDTGTTRAASGNRVFLGLSRSFTILP
ncbi:hypothetical protein [Rhodosalinus sp. FB01]|uniref:hypothetical protein n=1 Tax=Rhodosalinus sp. FB01 TaxID=3239194 RepID=UPI0035262B95